MSADPDGVLEQLTPDEKAGLLAGRDMWHVAGVPRVGLRDLRMTDGPAGARGTETTGVATSISFPCGIALAATWDVDLVERVGAALGDEARAKGAHVLLGPTVNMHRTPLAGRHFECFSEDPHLAARLAVAYIRGVQSRGVAACVKHFVANDSEFERFTIDARVPPEALREIYLAPFEAAVREAGVWALMAAYNRVDGVYCSEQPALLTGILRDEWGFDGAVVSDWLATHSTVDALVAGLDCEMPGPPLHRGERLRDAVARGEVDAAAIDASVRRMLRLAARTGALGDPALADSEAGDRPSPQSSDGERTALAGEAAAAAIVLLQNEPVDGATVLPLRTPRAIAVIGPLADAEVAQGGGSAHVTPAAVVTALEGIAARAGTAVAVVHEPGPPVWRGAPSLTMTDVRTAAGARGMLVEHFAGPPSGTPVAGEHAREARLRWAHAPVDRSVPGGWSLRITTIFTARAAGPHRFEVRTDGAVRIVAGGHDHGAGDGERHVVEVLLAAGDELDLEIEVTPAKATGPFAPAVDLRLLPPVPVDAFERAVAAAARSDVAVVVIGHDDQWETEGRDRDDFALPGRQDDLVAAVAAVNPRTVVVLVTGAPVAMPWAATVPAIVQQWFAGQDGGAALAAVLFGDQDPSGRLPCTIPVRIEDTPAFTQHPARHGVDRYGEGRFIGYRWYDARGIVPRFAFGHGLSYTTFAYGPVRCRDVIAAGEPFEVAVDVTNTGAHAGSDVVQVYVSGGPATGVVKQLRAFRPVHLEPGETTTVRCPLDERALASWDPTAEAFRVEPGTYEIVVARSAGDVQGVATVTVK